ncbi:MAG TPA: hypothetical protein VGR73_04025 [Bryobacteraceae bacterium]|nr:hypothetical protein [Bryobacteraceae bacterium]
MTRIFVTILFAGTALAQVSGPVLGYLPVGGTLRTMYGIPASGAIGPLMRAGRGFSKAVASPSGSFALASTESGAVAALSPADGESLRAAIIPDAMAGDIHFSPNGSAALIASGGRLQVIGGLPAFPAVIRTLDVSFLGGASALAASDDGQWVAGVFGGLVYALGSSSQVIALPAPAGVTALTFFHGTGDLAVTTASQIAKISELGGSPAVSTIFGSSNGPAPPESPMALALTSDNGRIVLLEPDGGIGQVDLKNGAISTAKCGCTPQGLFGLGGSVFRLSGLSGGSVKVYDAASGNVWFVPLALAGAEGGRR